MTRSSDRAETSRAVGLAFFDPNNPNGRLLPGIGRNSFRGPKYFAVDLSLGKRTGLPAFLGEAVVSRS